MRTVDRPERSLHHAQCFADSCQPACVAMALARRGAGPAAQLEARLHAGANGAGHPVNPPLGVNEPRVRCAPLVPDSEGLCALRETLASRAWVMVQLFGPRWARLVPKDSWGAHGPLCPPGDYPKPLHAVLVVACTARTFIVLDPFCATPSQPFELSDAELMDVLSGFPSLVLEA